MAKNLVMSLTDYFDIPFLLPQPSRPGQVDVDWGVLNIRARPELGAPSWSRPPDGAPLTVLEQHRRLVSGGLLRNSGLRQTGFYHIDLTPPERRFLWTSMWFSRETPLYELAYQYGVSMSRLIQDNQLPDPSQLVVGQTLVIQYPRSTCTVRSGDTFVFHCPERRDPASAASAQ